MNVKLCEINENNAYHLLSKGNAEQAKYIFVNILNVNADSAEAWHGLACHARYCGNDATAITLVARALRCTAVTDEQRARYHITLGAALLGRGQAEPARAAFAVARALNACDPRALTGLAEALVALDKLAEARAVLERAVTLAADDAPTLTRLAELNMESGALKDAVVCFRRVVECVPADGRAWANLGIVLYQASLQQPEILDEAKSALERAVVLGAKTAETLNTQGLVHMALGELGAAREALSAALVMASDNAVIANNLGTLLEELGEVERAEAVYEAVMQRETGRTWAQSCFNRGILRLGQGRYAEGWADFEARRLLAPQAETLPQWDGSAGDAPIMVTAEQGLGDQVQFMRYLPEVLSRRPVRLSGAFAELVPFIPSVVQERLVTSEAPVESTVGLLSLPAILGAGVPSSAPYLRATAAAEPLRVGLCWAGGAGYRFDRRRSVGWGMMQRLLDVPGVRFVSLQQGGVVPAEVERVPLGTLPDLLAAVSQCSLVISVDTLVAHVAGAVGRPLWLLNRYGGDWRWRRSDWYASCEQVFQPGHVTPPPECWLPVMEELADALKQWSVQAQAGEG